MSGYKADYRDDLNILVQRYLQENRSSVGEISEQAGLSRAALRHVLAKRVHMSLPNLEAILSIVGFRIVARRQASNYTKRT